MPSILLCVPAYLCREYPLFCLHLLTLNSKLCAGHYFRPFISVSRFLFICLFFMGKKKFLDSYGLIHALD